MTPEARKFWSGLSMHRDYVADDARNLAYLEAITRHVSPGSRVLDIGTGTGILAMFAAQAGAARVVALDASSLLPVAAQSARRSGLAERIEFVHSDLFDWRSDERFDLIVHELIGGFLWEENLAAVFERARARHLRPGGRFLPTRVDLFLAPAELAEDAAAFWERDHYGLDLSAFAPVERASQRGGGPTIVHLRGDARLLGAPMWAATLDSGAPEAQPDAMEVELVASRRGRFDAVVGWFTVHLDETTRLSTSPLAPATHWGQLSVPLARPLAVEPGDALDARVETAAHHADWRASAHRSP